MKVVHISDLHYGKHSGVEQLIEKIIHHYQAAPKKPKVVFTGDLVESALDKREMHEIKLILRQLPSNGFDLMLCPGNHDIKIKGAAGNPHHYISCFDKYFRELLPKGVNYLGEEDNDLLDFPIIHQFDQHFFIGLNSLAGRPFLTRGRLGKTQLKALTHSLAGIRSRYPKAVIITYLHNNPFYFNYRYHFLKLRDRKAFRKILQGTHILLSGHWHGNLRYSSEESKYNINCIQVSGRSTSSSRFIAWTEIDTSDFSTKECSFPKHSSSTF